MKYYDWDDSKNAQLKEERDISFEEVVVSIELNCLICIIKHPNEKQYPNQKIMILKIREYAYLVPFVEDDEKLFFKTIIPSRKATRLYILKKKEKNEIF